MSDQSKQKEILAEKYRAKGFQSMSLAEYEALRSKKSRRKRFDVPVYIKFVIGSPLLIIFLAGLLFLPYMLYVIFTGPYVGLGDKKQNKGDVSYNDLLTKKD